MSTMYLDKQHLPAQQKNTKSRVNKGRDVGTKMCDANVVAATYGKPKGNPKSRLEMQFGTPQHMHPKSSVSPRFGGQAQAQFFMKHVGKGA